MPARSRASISLACPRPVSSSTRPGSSANLQVLADVGERSGAHMLSALKAFSMFSLAPLVRSHLSGTCASGLYEARLGREEYGGEVTTFSTGYKDAEIDEIIALSDHLIFNSPAQKDRFGPRAAAAGVSVGLRLNPQHSEGEVPKYDPCQPGSRLGVPVSDLTPAAMAGVEGVHMHTLCEQGFEPLRRTWEAVEPMIAPYMAQLKWINLGGGHHITRGDYDRAALIDLIREIRARFGSRSISNRARRWRWMRASSWVRSSMSSTMPCRWRSPTFPPPATCPT